MRYIKVGMSSLILVLIVPFGFLFAAIFLGEEITFLKFIGAVFVIIGVILPQLFSFNKKRVRLKELALKKGSNE